MRKHLLIQNKTKLWSLLSILLIAFTLNTAHAQIRKRGGLRKKNRSISRFTMKKQPFPKAFRYTSFDFGISAFNYFGDLSPNPGIASTDINFTRPGLSFSLNHKVGPQFFVRSDFSWGRLQADDYTAADPNDANAVYRYIRNLQFRNDIKELNLLGVFTLFPNRSWYSRRALLNPYFFAGIAVIHHNPKALVPETDYNGNPLSDAGKWVSLQPLGTEGQHSDELNIKPYSMFQLAIPVGAGISLKMTNRIDLAFELGYRYLFFDYIDDVSGSYVDKGILSDPLAKVLSDRSTETIAVNAEEERNYEAILQKARPFTYIGADGQTYNTFAGYGHGYSNGNTNRRGNPENNDIYLVTTIRLSYILSRGGKRASSRILDFR